MDIIKNYHDKKWIIQFLNALYNNIDINWHTNGCGKMFHFGRLVEGKYTHYSLARN
jgi:hypothetical protein